MGLFNFDYDDGRFGHLGVSRYWWIYFVTVIPLTAATFWALSRAVKSHKSASDKETKNETGNP